MTAAFDWLLVSLATALISSLFAEGWAWLPRVAELIVRRAASRLPTAHRDRYTNEWLAELDAIPGVGLWRFVFAIRIFASVRATGHALGAGERELLAWRVLHILWAIAFFVIFLPELVLWSLIGRLLVGHKVLFLRTPPDGNRWSGARIRISRRLKDDNRLRVRLVVGALQEIVLISNGALEIATGTNSQRSRPRTWAIRSIEAFMVAAPVAPLVVAAIHGHTGFHSDVVYYIGTTMGIAGSTVGSAAYSVRRGLRKDRAADGVR